MIPGLELYAKDLAMVTTVAVITYLSLIIGELVPKSMALNNPERYATLLSPFMIILTKVSYPFVCLLSASTKLTNKLIGMKDGEERQMTQEELKMILHQSSEQGVIDKEETEMLRDVFRFSDKRANDLMTHRRDVIVLHPSDTQEEVLRIIQEEHFSKYLLVENGKDEIIGVVSVKDILEISYQIYYQAVFLNHFFGSMTSFFVQFITNCISTPCNKHIDKSMISCRYTILFL